jgi:hypothetical protein
VLRPSLDNNRLVGGSSPPNSTTQSYTNRDFPARPRIAPNWRDSWAHFISASYRLDFRGRFGALVSAPQNPVSQQRKLVQSHPNTRVLCVRRRVRDWWPRLPVAAAGLMNSSLIHQRARTVSPSGKTAAAKDQHDDLAGFPCSRPKIVRSKLSQSREKAKSL